MKARILCLILAVSVALCLCACGKEADPPTDGGATTTVSTAPSETTTTTTTDTTTDTADTTTTTDTTTAPTTTAPTTTKTTTTTVVTTTVSTGTTTITLPPTTTTTAAPAKQWELYWSDEFEGDTLDKSKWNIESGTSGPIVKKAENVKVEGGDCVITLHRDDSTAGYEYSSAYVTTANKFSFCYGRLEFRAKLPVGQAVWPALWTMGNNYLTIGDDTKAWPLCGEIDVMELVGSSDPNNPFDNRKITGTLHWGPNRDAHEQAHGIKYLLTGNASLDYHIYAIEWDDEQIVWYVDDEEYMTVPLDDPDMGTAFMQKHWIIMNINLYEWGASAYNETTPDSVSMYVDYVRVYKEKK